MSLPVWAIARLVGVCSTAVGGLGMQPAGVYVFANPFPSNSCGKCSVGFNSHLSAEKPPNCV